MLMHKELRKSSRKGTTCQNAQLPHAGAKAGACT